MEASGAPAEADRRLLRFIDAALSAGVERFRDRIACRPGCRECCIGPFPINRLDAERLRRGFEEMLLREPGRADRIRRRARDAVELFAPHFPGDLASGVLGAGDEAEYEFLRRFESVPCPALHPQSGVCELYAHRPVSCRSFGPPLRFGRDELPPCRLCFVGATPEEIDAARIDVDPENHETWLLTEHGLQQTLIAYCLTGG